MGKRYGLTAACWHCGSPVLRKPGTTARRYCSPACRYTAQTRVQCHACDRRVNPATHVCLREPEQPHFPGAAYRYLDETPETCDRCGAPWRLVPDGLACRMCPRHVYVAESLTSLVRHGAAI
jgi:hypothetical protein